jgi:hypothetical protein
VPVSTTHRLQTPAGKLRRPLSEIGARRSGQATFECCFLTRTDRLRGFDVKSRRDSSRPTPVRYAGDFDRAFHRADRDLDASAEHRMRSSATGLEQPRRP